MLKSWERFYEMERQHTTAKPLLNNHEHEEILTLQPFAKLPLCQNFARSDRGVGIKYGPDVTTKFCSQNRLRRALQRNCPSQNDALLPGSWYEAIRFRKTGHAGANLENTCGDMLRYVDIIVIVSYIYILQILIHTNTYIHI